jgi:hypothetical protein
VSGNQVQRQEKAAISAPNGSTGRVAILKKIAERNTLCFQC